MDEASVAPSQMLGLLDKVRQVSLSDIPLADAQAIVQRLLQEQAEPPVTVAAFGSAV